jgi:hypothetical protein
MLHREGDLVNRKLITRLIFAQVLDALTLAYFWIVIGPGEHSEQNPLINMMIVLGGIQLVLLVKIGLALWVGYRIGHPPKTSHWWSKPITSSRFMWVQTVAISVATASGVVGAGFNLASIVHSSTGFLFVF